MQRNSFYERISSRMPQTPHLCGSVRSFDSALAGLRIGPVSYLNSKPLIWGLNPALLNTDIPAELSRKFFAGELDIALLPVFEILRAGGARIVDDVAIACRGEVYSVIVASRTAFAKQWNNLPGSRFRAVPRRCCVFWWPSTIRRVPQSPQVEPFRKMERGF